MRVINTWLIVMLLLALIICIITRNNHVRAQAPRTVTTYSAGVIQINSTTIGTHHFATALPAGVGCAAGPLSDITRMSSIGWQVATTTTSVTITLSRAGTGRFWFLCFAPVN
jgi:hypothetical protein